MRRTRFDDWPCPVARATDLIGDWWTPLVLREAFLGRRRFGEFHDALGAPRAVLSARLDRLCEEGMLRRVEYQSNPSRHEYLLTQKGIEFWPVLAAMWRWGSDWLWDDHEVPPVVLKDRETGAVIDPVVVDEHSGEPVAPHRVRIGTNPAARSD